LLVTVGRMVTASSHTARRSPLLRESEVAALFEVNARTVRRWAKRGHLHLMTIGGLTRYRRAEIERLITGEDTKARGWSLTASGRRCGAQAETRASAWATRQGATSP
jgi:DNA-binding transcriptional MerR regulator